VNEATFRAMERGVVTSATVLANGPAVEEAARVAPKFPNCSFGVHLNLTEFTPVGTNGKGLSSLLDEHGCFHSQSIRQVAIGRSLRKAVFEEWSAQIERLIRLGLQPSHLDAHHHVHTIPQLLPVLVALRRRFGIDKVRISRNIYDPVDTVGQRLRAEKWLFNSTLRGMGFKTVAKFMDLVIFLRVCAECPPDAPTVELMTHPGSPLEEEESKLLAGNWTKRLSYTPVLVSYKAL